MMIVFTAILLFNTTSFAGQYGTDLWAKMSMIEGHLAYPLAYSSMSMVNLDFRIWRLPIYVGTRLVEFGEEKDDCPTMFQYFPLQAMLIFNNSCKGDRHFPVYLFSSMKWLQTPDLLYGNKDSTIAGKPAPFFNYGIGIDYFNKDQNSFSMPGQRLFNLAYSLRFGIKQSKNIYTKRNSNSQDYNVSQGEYNYDWFVSIGAAFGMKALDVYWYK
jgi:hypothetical protein